MAGLGDNTGGTVTYNGIALAGDGNQIAPAKIGLSGSHKYDESGRSVAYTEWTLTVRTTIWGDTEADTAAEVRRIRDALEKPSKRLTVSGIGVGSFAITENSINRGVKPRNVSVEQVAGHIAIDISFECVFASSDASPGAVVAGVFSEFNYDVAYAYDRGGLTTRIITGYYRIPNDRRGTADALREGLRVTIPLNYQRVRSEASESRDKMRVDFAYVDEEKGHAPFPPGIEHADGQTTWATASRGFVKWSFTISGTLTTAMGYPPSLAGRRFFEAVIEKRRKIAASLPGATIIPVAFTMSPGMWQSSRTTSLSITFLVTRCLKDILANGSPWAPLPNSADWSFWQKSMDHLVGDRATRGHSGLRMTSDSNVVISINDAVSQVTLAHESKTSKPSEETLQQVLDCSVTAESSYVGYDTRVQLSVVQNLSILRKALSITPPSSVAGALTGAWSFLFPGASSVIPLAQPSASSGSSKNSHVVEYHGTPHTRVLIDGKAARIGSKPEISQVSSIAGRKAIEIDRFDQTEHKDTYFGCKLFVRRWWILYDVEGDLTGYTIESPKPRDVCD